MRIRADPDPQHCFILCSCPAGENPEWSDGPPLGGRIRPARDCQRAAQQRNRLLRGGRGRQQCAARGGAGGECAHCPRATHRVQVRISEAAGK